MIKFDSCVPLSVDVSLNFARYLVVKTRKGEGKKSNKRECVKMRKEGRKKKC